MIIDKAIETIENGQRALVVTNCKRQARQLYLAAQKQDKKHLYISGDNPGDIDVKLLFENVNREAPNYDLIVTSPSVSSGISIDEDIFGFVGGIFEPKLFTPMLVTLNKHYQQKKMLLLLNGFIHINTTKIYYHLRILEMISYLI
jgi:hypothetical protein